MNQKLFFLILTITLFSVSTKAKEELLTLSAEGFQEIEIGASLNPFANSTVEKAEIKARKNLRKRCKEEFGGKITGPITTDLLRYDTKIMGALVEANGICQIDK